MRRAPGQPADHGAAIARIMGNRAWGSALAPARHPRRRDRSPRRCAPRRRSRQTFRRSSARRRTWSDCLFAQAHRAVLRRCRNSCGSPRCRRAEHWRSDYHPAGAQGIGCSGRSISVASQRAGRDIIDEFTGQAAESRPRLRDPETSARGGWKFTGRKRPKAGPIRIGDSYREVVKPGVVADQKDVTDVLGKAAKTAHEFNLACLIKLVLDHTPRSDRELGEDQLHGFARPPGARAQDKVEIPYRRRKSLADPACGLATTAVQGSLVIFDLLLPARLGVA